MRVHVRVRERVRERLHRRILCPSADQSNKDAADSSRPQARRQKESGLQSRPRTHKTFQSARRPPATRRVGRITGPSLGTVAVRSPLAGRGENLRTCEEARGNGRDGGPMRMPLVCPRSGDTRLRARGAGSGPEADVADEARETKEPLKFRGSDVSSPSMSTVVASAPHWARTSNLRFRRPMLYPIELGVLKCLTNVHQYISPPRCLVQP